MPFLLDTNAWISFLKGRDSLLVDRLTRTPPDEIRVCAPVRAELMHGARKYAVPDSRRQKVAQLLARYISLPFDDACADRYGAIRDDLESRSCVIGVMDM